MPQSQQPGACAARWPTPATTRLLTPRQQPQTSSRVGIPSPTTAKEGRGAVLARRQLLPVIVALIHDNSMQAMGQFVGEGQLLEGLAEVGTGPHAVLAPLLFSSWDAMAGAGLSYARRSCSCSGRAPSVLGVRRAERPPRCRDRPSWNRRTLTHGGTGGWTSRSGSQPVRCSGRQLGRLRHRVHRRARSLRP